MLSPPTYDRDLLQRACAAVHLFDPELANWLRQSFDLPPPQPLGLTERELEVAMLAAGGLSNLQISHRLYISIRTVECHLARVYTKLGVRSRRELPASLGN
jgi:DNA-binding NarL/FixJ family response regulator